MTITENRNTFNAGELSPKLLERSDLEKYRSGCETLSNFVVTHYGGVIRRPGTVYIGETKDSASASSLIEFNVARSLSYMIEMGAGYGRIYKDGSALEFNGPAEWQTTFGYFVGDEVVESAIVYTCLADHTSDASTFSTDAANWEVTTTTLAGWQATFDYVPGDFVVDASVVYYCLTGHTSDATSITADLANWEVQSAYEFVTPYAADEVSAVQFVQLNDVMFLVHPNHPPQQLSRNMELGWTMEDVEFDDPPFLDRNTTDVTITPGGTTGTGISLTASDDVFDDLHVGAYFRIGHVRGSSTITALLNQSSGVTTTSGISILGKYNVRTSGVWAATIEVQKSTDAWVSNTVVHTITGEYNLNKDVELEQSGSAALYRLEVTHVGFVSSTPQPRAWIEPQDGEVFGYVKITGVTDARNATCDVIDDLHSIDPTTIWQEGAWSDYQGYPRTVAVHDQRVWYAGTSRRPQTTWASEQENYLNFLLGVGDSDPVSFTLAGKELNAIQWMLSEEVLLIGTLGGEWVVSGSDKSSPATPSSVRARNPTKIGSSDVVPAVIVDDVALFVEPAGTRVRETTFSFEADKYVTIDVTLLSEHILGPGIVDFAYQKQRDPVLWCVLDDGTLASLTYNRAQNVVGWARHSTDGAFEAVSVIYGGGDDEEDDQVWFVVNRTIDGSTVRYLERFAPGRFRGVEDEIPADWVYLDCATVKNNGDSTALSGLDHLEGETVSVLNDGAKEPAKVVTGGAITLDQDGGDVVVGLPYTSELKTTAFEMAAPDGVSVNRKKRVIEAAVAFYKSQGGEIGGQPGGDWKPVITRNTTDVMGAGSGLKTHTYEERLSGRHDGDATVRVRSSDPFPMMILGITPKFEVNGQ